MKFIPIKGSGDFNIDLKKVKVALKVVLRLKEDINTDQILNLEHFEGKISFYQINISMMYFQCISAGEKTVTTVSNLMGC